MVYTTPGHLTQVIDLYRLFGGEIGKFQSQVEPQNQNKVYIIKSLARWLTGASEYVKLLFGK